MKSSKKVKQILFLSEIYKNHMKNNMITFEQLYENLKNTYHCTHVYKNEEMVEVDNRKELIFRLKHLSGCAIGWIEKLEKEVQK